MPPGAVSGPGRGQATSSLVRVVKGQAAEAKAEGTKMFKSGDVAGAVQKYDEGLIAVEGVSTLKKQCRTDSITTAVVDEIEQLRLSMYSNRAMFHLQLKQWTCAV